LSSSASWRWLPLRIPFGDGVIWMVTAVALVLWLIGLILRLGQWVNLLLLLAAVLLVYQVIEERRPRGD
jgi:4-hydroxybenzoate polyprenyltransferase